ncbi:MAG: DPP IV N-terminal domain-containing protein [Ignavibacteriales bacterium]|nr:DPP IV N-terminal domain-containing protein [Ignavibacteriales bacterium]MCF8316453.1 DPP IV N-terminal domain-containing protein [Ignavibacteriales bacterium]MCF8437933.1 DPP IV N-terminal domain-containing protein [Ignavibacteriales bacterium]
MTGKKINWLILLLVITALSFGQNKKITFDQTFRGGSPSLFNRTPRISGWLDDNNYLEQKSERSSGINQIISVNAQSGKLAVYLDYNRINSEFPEGIKLESAEVKDDFNNHFIIQNEGNYFYFDRNENTLKQLEGLSGEPVNLKFSPDFSKLAYTKNNDLYYYNIETGEEFRLTSDGSELILNGYASWVYYEEILGRSSQYAAFWWSPNSDRIAYLRFDDNPVPEFHITQFRGQHGKLESARYPKAGDPNPGVKIGIVQLNNGNTTWIHDNLSTDIYIAWPFWSPDGNTLLYQVMNRAQDQLQIFGYGIQSGKSLVLYSENQNSWVEFFENIIFLKNGKEILILSDKSGWKHILKVDLNSGKESYLTEGNWSVNDFALVNEDKEQIFFTAYKESSTDRDIYSVGLDGGEVTRISEISGTHSPNFSTAGTYFIDSYSNINTPTVINLMHIEKGLVRELGSRKSEIMDQYALPEIELTRIKTPDGYDLPVKITRPADFDESKKYPAVISIYGGPGAATVRNSYPMWLMSFFMAQNGIIFVEVDHRGSGHFGKEGMALMHRQLGKWEMEDYIFTAKWLQSLPYIIPDKIGITGGSYGGYVVAMALTYGSDFFTCGISDFPVTDWLLYDNVYTERYMDTPAENPEGYKAGSVLTHTEKYKGGLLIRHGTIDDNVHVQNTMWLIDKLQDENKSFELMIYPGSRHGFSFSKRTHSYQEEMNFWFKKLLNKDFTMDN